jgi:predicted GIY-YIG superfamily endonuclease
MITTTIRAVRAGNHDYDDDQGLYLYVIRALDAALYVGQSRSPAARVMEHVQGGARSQGRLHRLFRAHTEEALDWTVEFWTLADCLPLVRIHARPHVVAWYEQTITTCEAQDAISDAEHALIRHYRPALNVRHNDGPSCTPLPARFAIAPDVLEATAALLHVPYTPRKG